SHGTSLPAPDAPSRTGPGPLRAPSPPWTDRIRAAHPSVTRSVGDHRGVLVGGEYPRAVFFGHHVHGRAPARQLAVEREVALAHFALAAVGRQEQHVRELEGRAAVGGDPRQHLGGELSDGGPTEQPLAVAGGRDGVLAEDRD